MTARPGALAARESSGCAPKSARTFSRAGSPPWTLKRIEGDTVRLSVPTRFLKSWIQSHYTDAAGLLAGRAPTVRRIESGALRGAPHRDRQGEAERAGRDGARAAQRRRRARAKRAPRSCPVAGRARRARRLAARSAADLRHLRGRPLQHAGACRRQAGRARRGAASR